MTTLIVKGNSLSAQQFLAFARTLPYVDIIENPQEPFVLKETVAEGLIKSEQGEELIVCKDAMDMFHKLGI